MIDSLSDRTWPPAHRPCRWPVPRLTITERDDGFRQAYREVGLEIDEELIRYTDSRIPSARLRIEELLSLRPPVRAIFATVAFLTLGVLQVLRARGISCAQDISVLGFDDPDWAGISQPAVTTMEGGDIPAVAFSSF